MEADSEPEFAFVSVEFVIGTIFIIVITKFLYNFLCKPINRIKNFTDIGYEHIHDEYKKRGLKLKELTNKLRKSKKIGMVPPIYPNGWFGITESHEVKKESVKSISALGERFAVFRGKVGQIFVLDAYCCHLGADLSVGGRVVDDCLECPFHGWQFDGKNGRCVKIPYTDKVPTIAKVKKWESTEQNGWIYIWYHAENEPPQWHVPSIPEIRIWVNACPWIWGKWHTSSSLCTSAEINNGEFRYVGTAEHLIAVHPQDLAENTCDTTHLSFLHKPTTFAGIDLRYIWSKNWQFLQHIIDGEWEEGNDQSKHIATARVSQKISLFGKCIPKSEAKITVTLLGPGIVHVETFSYFGRGVLVDSITPIGPMEVKFGHRLYAERSMPIFIANFIYWTEFIMFERDIAIWNNKTFNSKPILVKEDKFINRFRRWYSQFYSENSPRLFYNRNSYNW